MNLKLKIKNLKAKCRRHFANFNFQFSIRDSREAGYSLIEAIIVVSLFSLATLAIMGTILFLYRTNANSIEQAYALQNARKGVEVMVRDIREATYGDEGSYPVVAMSTSSFTFFSDTDKDDSVERIRYFLQGSNLYRGVVQATGTPAIYATSSEEVLIVSEDVRNIDQDADTFVFYNASGTQVTNFTSELLDTRFVIVTLIVNINPTRLPEEFTLRSSAMMRNLKDNL